MWSTMDKTTIGIVAFLSGHLVLGVGAFVYVFCVQRRSMGSLCCCGQHDRLKGFQNVHTFLCALLTMDVVHVAVTVVSLVFIEFIMFIFGGISLVFLNLSRYFMVFVHLITALTSICYLCDPPSEGRLCCMAPVMLVLFMAFVAVAIYVTHYIVIILGPVTFGLVLAIILKNRSSRACKWKTPIVIVAMISFLVVFLPSFVLYCLIIAQVDVFSSFFILFVFATNIQLFLDALLCFFILKLHMEEQQRCQRPNNDSAVPLTKVHSNPPEYKTGFALSGETADSHGDSCGDIDGGGGGD